MKQIKANASVWNLLVASKKHRDVMYKALENLLISIEFTLEELVMLVSFKDSLKISFSIKT